MFLFQVLKSQKTNKLLNVLTKLNFRTRKGTMNITKGFFRTFVYMSPFEQKCLKAFLILHFFPLGLTIDSQEQSLTDFKMQKKSQKREIDQKS